MAIANSTLMLNHFDPRPRLLTLLGASGLIYVLLPKWMLLPTRLLLAWDVGVICFLILAFVTCQIADVATTSRSMKRLALLVHGVLTFFFNTVILALSINIIAGLI